MKVIFLDFDGVLNSHSGYAKRDYEKIFIKYAYSIFEEHIEALNWLMKDLEDVKIIISSTWRKFLSLDEIKELMIEKGFKYPETIYSTTPFVGSRTEDIRTYLNENNVEDYVIIDDKKLLSFYDKFCLIDSRYGFTHYDAALCKAKFSGNNLPLILF